MAMPATQLQGQTFSEWLRQTIQAADLNGSSLQQLLVRKGYSCTAESVRR